MKKFLLTTLCMLCMVLFAQAQDVAFTFNSTTYGYTKNTNNPKALTIDGVTISFAQGNSSTPPAFNNTSQEVRMYGGKSTSVLDGNTMTVKAEGKSITKIVLFFGSTSNVNFGELTCNTGKLEFGDDVDATKYTANDMIWTGDAEEVVFTCNRKTTGSSTQVRWKSATVTLAAEEGAVVAPVITLGANNTVTIEQEEGADIYYTLDGTEPTAASTKYTAAFTISGKTTVKAVAIKDGKSSSVTTKNLLPNTVANIAEFVELANPDATTVTGSMIALYQNGRNLYVRDAENDESYLLIYNSNDIEGIAGQYTNGDIIAGATGSFKSQAGLPEMIPSSLGAKTAGTAIAPVELSLEEIGSDMLNWYVKVSDVNITAASAANNYNITDGSREMVMFNSFYNSQYYDAVEVPEGEGFTVTGFVSVYNNTMQLIPVLIEGGKVMETVATPVFNPESGAELKAGEKITITTETEGAEIRYTTDGTEPTAESTLYTEEGIEFTEDVTIKAIAVKEGMLDSDVATASYTLYIEGSAKATFDFTDPSTLNPAPEIPTETTTQIKLNVKNNNNVFTSNGITLTFGDGTNTNNSPVIIYPTAAATKGNIEGRIYVNNTITLSGTGIKINKVTFTQREGSTTWAGFSDSEGTWNKLVWTPTTPSASVEFTSKGTSRYGTITVEYVQDTEAIEGIDADNSNAPVEYYNLQGIRVNADNMPAGIYIRRQGTAVSKVLVK